MVTILSRTRGPRAARRSALEGVGGLIDFAILGSADRYMAAGLLGFMEDTIATTCSPIFLLQTGAFQRKQLPGTYGTGA